MKTEEKLALALAITFVVFAISLMFVTQPAKAVERVIETVYIEPEPPEPVIMTVYKQVENRYSELNLNETDLELIARLVYLEARGESFTGQRMVAEVVLNRVLSDRFPNTVGGVLYQEGQFTPAKYIESTEPTAEQYEAVNAAYNDEHPVTNAETVYFARGAQNKKIFGKVGNHVFCDL